MRNIAIVGGGPSALLLFKHILASGQSALSIDIYEKGKQLGCGMPYSPDGAACEHVTNVSANEIPELVTSVIFWLKNLSKETCDRYHINPETFHEYKVLPRLVFGHYLRDQFSLLLIQAKISGIKTRVFYQTPVDDITDDQKKEKVTVISSQGRKKYRKVVVCTGHSFPSQHEESYKGYFDSPYPPQKIHLRANHPVAIRGASLTAIDAVRTLSLANGRFDEDTNGKLHFVSNEDSENFKIILHSRNGLLPSVRCHLVESYIGHGKMLLPEQIAANRLQNDGFLSLDYVFETVFLKALQPGDLPFGLNIRHLNLEAFAAQMMIMRKNADPFELLRAEYEEAAISIKNKKSIRWKELLAGFSLAMNYPAKYYSAEDRLRLERALMPLISVVIAFMPQSSAEMILALHEAGRLTMVRVNQMVNPEPDPQGGACYNQIHYPLFVDCIGQQHYRFDDLCFKGLTRNADNRARLMFRDSQQAERILVEGNQQVSQVKSGAFYLTVPGLSINDAFQLNQRIYIMSAPMIGGYNPDYSGLDFCETAAMAIINNLFKQALAIAS